MAYFLETDERQRLIAIVANLYQVTDGGAQGRRVLLWTAGLQKFVTTLRLSDSPDIVAPGIISLLEDHGYLEERPAYHALGALLASVLQLPELSTDNKKYLAGLIVKYSLVNDPVYIQDLRSKYGITDQPARSAPAQNASPPPAKVQVAQPDFAVDTAGLERVIHDEDNFLHIDLLASAVVAAQAVCRIEIPRGKPVGTGFLVGPDLLLTNQHVVHSDDEAASACARFDYWADWQGVASQGRTFACEPKLLASSPPEQLDYSLLRLTDTPLREFMAGDEWKDLPALELLRRRRHRGFLLLSPRKVTGDERVNIIQHPLGTPLKAVLTQNRVAAVTGSRLQYVADTDEGSSGSPVFDQSWSVVALHHSGKPWGGDQDLGATAKRLWSGKFKVNEGISMTAILQDFAARGMMALLPR